MTNLGRFSACVVWVCVSVATASDDELQDLFNRPEPGAMREYDPVIESRLPSNMLVVRAQPAVYRVLNFGDIELRIPKSVIIDLNTIREAWDAQEKPGNATDEDKNAYIWAELIADLGTYVLVTDEQVLSRQEDQLMSSGTGFLVSREGIVLTNAHVIADMDDQPLPGDPLVRLRMLGSHANDWVGQFTELVGAAPDDELKPAVFGAVLEWLGEEARITGKFKRAELAMSLSRPSWLTPENINLTLDELLERPMDVVSVPTEVLAVGEPMPGRDVAVLRCLPGAFPVTDKAICLPLGDSDDLLPGERLQALGFPGIAYNEYIMSADAEYRCSAQDGQFANTKRMTGKWDALEMTNDINHGDSGGPVINAQGFVVGLNVGSAQGASSHTLAVPINVAKAFLEEVGVTPDPGPATAAWVDALQAFAERDYDEARRKLTLLIEMQAGRRDEKGNIIPDTGISLILGTPEVNPYLFEMEKRVVRKLAAAR
jgi:S1-C subfamily serine protease